MVHPILGSDPHAPAEERATAMPDRDHQSSNADLRFRALPRWDNEGGAIALAPAARIPPLTATDLIQLRIRTIALENMLIAVLSEGTDRQLQVARDMAAYIAPRPGFTDHPLTIEAGRHMTALIDRALHFRTVTP